MIKFECLTHQWFLEAHHKDIVTSYQWNKYGSSMKQMKQVGRSEYWILSFHFLDGKTDLEELQLRSNKSG